MLVLSDSLLRVDLRLRYRTKPEHSRNPRACRELFCPGVIYAPMWRPSISNALPSSSAGVSPVLPTKPAKKAYETSRRDSRSNDDDWPHYLVHVAHPKKPKYPRACEGDES